MTEAIRVERLSKDYGRAPAVQELTFSVESGTIYGLIGPNGAGKTTTLSILAGLLAPTSGLVSILDKPVVAGRASAHTESGFYSSQFGFFDYLTGREILALGGGMNGLTPATVETRIDDLLNLFDLQPAADHYVYEYSHGMRQKLGLAAALIHAPAVLLLDEPFDGLDPTSLYRLVATLRAVSDAGKSVLLTSHDLALVERVCGRVGVLNHGRMEREIDLNSDLGPSRDRRSALEAALWEIVGAPTYEPLTWI